MMIFSSIYWNPQREIFVLPFFNIPILWYGFFFALGFGLGYFIFAFLLRRFFVYFPKYVEKDVLSWKELFIFLKKTDEKIFLPIQKKISSYKKYSPTLNSLLISCLNELLVKESREVLDQKLEKFVLNLKKRSLLITDRSLVAMIFATVVGSRLGHLIFYEKPSSYLKDPLSIFKTWEGGLASHGAAFAIILVIYFSSKWMKKHFKKLDWIKLLDFICVPAALTAGFIRLGNFFNQEVLGKPTNHFFAITFGNPMDRSFPLPRHPVQLYEALFYFLTFFILFYLSLKKDFLLARGKILGLFLVLIFSFRFLVEFLKEHQSYFLTQNNFLNMGQYLSIPLVLLGLIFFYYKRIKKNSFS